MTVLMQGESQELTGRALALLLEGAEAAEQEKLKVFAGAFLKDAAPDVLAHTSAESLAGMIGDLYRFADCWKKDEGAKLRVYDPAPEREGWSSDQTAITVINQDMPFLVDSLTTRLNRLGIEVLLVVHPILFVERDRDGRLLSLKEASSGKDGRKSESHMLVLISRQPQERHEEIRRSLQSVFADVDRAVTDWMPMQERCREIVRQLEQDPPPLAEAEIAEAIDFLRWLDDGHFIFLGYREYSYRGENAEAVAEIDEAQSLGLLRDHRYSVFQGLRNLGRLPVDVQAWVKTPRLLRVTKANRRSSVHRPAYLDSVAIKSFDEQGQVTGERVFIGLFTSRAYSQSPRDIPLLRSKLDDTLASSGFLPGSHKYRLLRHILESYPRDELFQIDQADLQRIALGILQLEGRQRTALFLRRDPFERFLSALIFVPRERFNTDLRLKLQAIMEEAFQGEVKNYSTFIDVAPMALLHLILRTEPGNVPEIEQQALEESLALAARSWSDELKNILIRQDGEAVGFRRFSRWGSAFPAGYREDFDEGAAAADIARMERLLEGSSLEVDLYQEIDAAAGAWRFKVYVAGRPLALSDVLPMLENMGLRVLGEAPYRILPEGAREALWIHDLSVEAPAARSDLAAVRAAFHEVFTLVWSGQMENDGFNRLVLSAGLRAREIRVLRAYYMYIRQLQSPYAQGEVERALADNPELTAKLAELFMQCFDPALQEGDSQRAEESLLKEIASAFEKVAGLDDDRILRRYFNLIQGTLRTNYFQTGPDGLPKPYIALKFDGQAIEELPEPRPFREIFVASAQVEGVHLRFGSVARGGLRWSDRYQDFRTEVLGLVKAQQVKNAVIVPVGAKGGFVAKQLPPPAAGREAFHAAGVAAYQTFIRGLLDITDNLEGEQVIAPAQVVRRDGDDPYLVVAADKGTATFSDIANELAAEYGFWLGDAFASGGSAGYDHKAMAITARGAWESVKRHFRELGQDVQKQDFTVVGCGDMSGDVFGNGMLRSRHIKLIGAFNHLHIFVDPDTYPA